MRINTTILTALLAALSLPEQAASRKSPMSHFLGSGGPALEPLAHQLAAVGKKKKASTHSHSNNRHLSGEPPMEPFPEETDTPEETTGTDAPEEEETDPVAPPVEDDTPIDEPTDDVIGVPPPVEGEVPINDLCDAALFLEPGESIGGSNTFATPESGIPFCEEFLGGNVTGVWYGLEGTGRGLEAVVNATFDMQMAVFGGTCEDLICVDGTAGDDFPFQSGDIKGASREGDVYYILVSGWEGSQGDFQISINEGDIPGNSECADAPMIELGESVEGTTEFASIPGEEQFPVCTIDEAVFGITSPTVWYTFVGTGSIVQFSVFADYDAQISIYEGDDCESLTCRNSNDDSPLEGPSSAIAQPLEEGQLYHINVHGFQKEYGDFTLESEELEPAENDNCEDAVPLELGVAVESNTLAATGDADLPLCGRGTNETSPGVWYSLTGTGNTLQLRLNGTLQLHFAVYTGGCDGLTCAGNQFFGFYPFTWDSVEGEDYLIYVYGRTHALTDVFSIIAEEVERPGNDECTAAVPLEVNEVITGTTRASSTEEGLDFCGNNPLGEFFGGVWYSFTGTGESQLVGVSAGADGGEGIFDTVVTVYTGNCDELTCLAYNDQGLDYQEFENAVALETVEGETYHVFVNGYGLSRGAFEIGLLGIPRPENDSCDTSTLLELGDTIEGSTEFAKMEDDIEFESCGTSNGGGNSSAPGIWYSVEGEGFAVQASVFGQYDIQLTVFSGASCDDAECVDGTEGNENDFFNGQVIWTAEEGELYHILVHGFNGATGEFELIYETAITRN